MEIKLDLQKKNDNTNMPHGSIILSTDNTYVFIQLADNSQIAVYRSDFVKAASIL